MDRFAQVGTATAAVVDEVLTCLAQLRQQADLVERARHSGSVREVEDAHAAARALLDRISVALLAGGTGSDETAPVLIALGASSAAEFARLEGRFEPALWQTAVQRWEAAALASHAVIAHDSRAAAG